MLSPWEFLTHWECQRLPPPYEKRGLSRWICQKDGSYKPDKSKESQTLLFFPVVPGNVQLRNMWFMQRRSRPMIPAPANTPMPENQVDAEAKARAFSVYMRPWTLDPATATEEVPHLVDLDKPYQRPGLDGERPPKFPRTRASTVGCV